MIFTVSSENLSKLFNLNENNSLSIDDSTLKLLIALKNEMKKNNLDIATSKEISELFSSTIEQSIYEDYITISESNETLITYLGSNTSMLEALNLYVQNNPNHIFHILSTDEYMSKLPPLYQTNQENSTSTLSHLPISVDMIIKNLLHDDMDINYLLSKSKKFELFLDEHFDSDSQNQNYLQIYKFINKNKNNKDFSFPASQIDLYLNSPLMSNIREKKPQDVLVYVLFFAHNKNKSIAEHIIELNDAILKELVKQNKNSLTEFEINNLTKYYIPNELKDIYFDIIEDIKKLNFDDKYLYSKQYSQTNNSEETLIRLIYPQLLESEKNLMLSEIFSKISGLDPSFSKAIPKDIAINICYQNISTSTLFKSIAHINIVKEYCFPIFKISELLKDSNENNEIIISILLKYFDKEERNNLGEYHASFKKSADYKDPEFPNKFLNLFYLLEESSTRSSNFDNENLAFAFSMYKIMDKVLFNFTVENHSEDFLLSDYFSHSDICHLIDKLLGSNHTDNKYLLSKYIKNNFSHNNNNEVEIIKQLVIKGSVHFEDIPIEFFFTQPIFNLFQNKISWNDKKKLPEMDIFNEKNISKENLKKLIDNSYNYKKEVNISNFLLNINSDLVRTLSEQEKNDPQVWTHFFELSPGISLPIFKKECTSYLKNNENHIFELILSKHAQDSIDTMGFLGSLSLDFLNKPNTLLQIIQQKDLDLTYNFLKTFNEKLLYVTMEIKNSEHYKFNDINDTLHFIVENYLLENSCQHNPSTTSKKPIKF